MGTLLHGVGFAWLLSLPTWGPMWTVYRSPLHRPTACGCRRGDMAAYQVLSCPVTTVGSGIFSGDAKPRAWIFGEVLII
jgi:hypothetical protein